MGSSTEIALNPNLYAKLGYDTVRDFAPITLVGSTPLLLVVHPSVPTKSVQDLARIACASPGRLNYASSGNGSSPHVAAEMFRWLAGGLDMVHVPFPNAGVGVGGVMSGQVEFIFAAAPNVVGAVRAGKLRALAISTTRRTPLLPDVPTMIEAGVKDYDIAIWNGMFTQAATPRDIVNRRHAELVKWARVVKASGTRLE